MKLTLFRVVCVASIFPLIGCVEGGSEIVSVPIASVRLDSGVSVSEAFLAVTIPADAEAVALQVRDLAGEVAPGSVSLTRDGAASAWSDVSDGDALDVLTSGWWRVERGDVAGDVDVAVVASVPSDHPAVSHASWMDDLGDAIHGTRLADLCLVGAHDAGTSGINIDSPWSDSAGLLGLSPASTAIRTSRAQERSLGHLLRSGVRYLDLRFDVGEDGTVRMVHSLLGQHGTTAMAEVRDFVDAYPNELVLLDVQHVSGPSPLAWDAVSDLLRDTFGDRIATRALGLDSTVAAFRDAGSPIVVLLGGAPKNALGDGRGWDRDDHLVSPWGNKQDLGELLTFLDDAVANRDTARLHVVQGVLTPNASVAVGWAGDETQAVIDAPCAEDDTTIGLCGFAKLATPAIHERMGHAWADADLDIVMVDHPELAPLVDACIERMTR